MVKSVIWLTKNGREISNSEMVEATRTIREQHGQEHDTQFRYIMGSWLNDPDNLCDTLRLTGEKGAYLAIVDSNAAGTVFFETDHFLRLRTLLKLDAGNDAWAYLNGLLNEAAERLKSEENR